MDWEAVYYLINFHKNLRWTEVSKTLAPRELVEYVVNYTRAISLKDSITSAEEEEIHKRAMLLAKET